MQRFKRTRAKSGLSSAISAQLTHHYCTDVWVYECKCVSVLLCAHWNYSHETGWTAKINKYERVEQFIGKSLAHWGLPHIVIACLGSNPPPGPITQVELHFDRARTGCSSISGGSNNQQMRGLKTNTQVSLTALVWNLKHLHLFAISGCSSFAAQSMKICVAEFAVTQ